MTSTLQVAKIIVGTEAEGPGVRSAIWLQGCPLRCPGCCNPEMLPFGRGEERSIESLAAEMWKGRSLLDGKGRSLTGHDAPIEGISLLGGEPFAQAEGAAKLAEAAQAAGLSVMVFSGFEIAELQSREDAATHALLGSSDILVDGPYRRELPEPERRWIGSTNQNMHFLSDRYDPQAPCFQSPNTVEIRFVPGSLTVSGWPSASDALVAPKLRRQRKR